jgi:Flp pilus assembly protein TadB
VTGFVLALCFAAGIALLLLGLSGCRLPGLPRPVGRLDGVILGVSAVGAILGWVVAWWICRVPIVALTAAAAGAYAPLALGRRRRSRATLDRERAWPAALAQLADALEAGIAFPAAVTLVADAGPAPLRREFAAFHGRLRSAIAPRPTRSSRKLRAIRSRSSSANAVA